MSLPSGARKATGGWLVAANAVVVFALFFYGVHLEFATDPVLGSGRAYAIALLLASLNLLVPVVLAKRAGRLRLPPRWRDRFWLASTPFLLGLVYQPVVETVLPAAYTTMVGTPVVETYAMQTESRYRKYECDSQLTGGPMRGFFADHLCIDETTYRRWPDQAVQVVLTGERSALGLRVRTIEILGPPDD